MFMPMTTAAWTPESVLALAPDPSSAKSGQGLAAARQWQGLGLGPGSERRG